MYNNEIGACCNRVIFRISITDLLNIVRNLLLVPSVRLKKNVSTYILFNWVEIS